jgi:hypothetical protein
MAGRRKAREVFFNGKSKKSLSSAIFDSKIKGDLSSFYDLVMVVISR